MKKILLLIALIVPMLLSAQTKTGKKNKTTIIILHPLQGESENFEKGLTQHNKDFHKGDAAVDIYEVITGERTGEYHFVYRNPSSWADVETAFNATNEKDHTTDWTQNVAKYISTPSPRFFYEVSDDSYLPANQSEMNTDLMGVYLIGINLGMETDFYAALKKINEMFKKNDSKNYYLLQSMVFGKGSQVAVVFPLPNGWSSFEPDPNADWSKMFKKAFPNEDYKAWIKKFNATQSSFESFVVKHRTDLSSPK
jgi:hypothetical protein